MNAGELVRQSAQAFQGEGLIILPSVKRDRMPCTDTGDESKLLQTTGTTAEQVTLRCDESKLVMISICDTDEAVVRIH